MITLTSEDCLRAAFNPNFVPVNILKNICSLAYNNLWQEEQKKNRDNKIKTQHFFVSTLKEIPCQCSCGMLLIKSSETNEMICPSLIS